MVLKTLNTPKERECTLPVSVLVISNSRSPFTCFVLMLTLPRTSFSAITAHCPSFLYALSLHLVPFQFLLSLHLLLFLQVQGNVNPPYLPHYLCVDMVHTDLK